MGSADVKPEEANPTASNAQEEHLYNVLDVALGKIRCSMIADLSSSSQVLSTVARHYAEQPSKYLRPVLIVLMGCATDKDSVKGMLLVYYFFITNKDGFFFVRRSWRIGIYRETSRSGRSRGNAPHRICKLFYSMATFIFLRPGLSFCMTT
jgi:hypothetical protein